LPVNDALATDDETISGSSRQQDFPMEPKRMNIHCVGVGKMPHLCVPNQPDPVVDFGRVYPGIRVPQTIEILNTTPVRASFHVHPLRGNGEVAPLPPAPFAVSPDSGVVEPSRTQAHLCS